MSTLFYPNLFFEEQLAAMTSSGGFRPSPVAKRLVNELAPVMGLLAFGRDSSVVVVDAEAIPTGLPEALANIRFFTPDETRDHAASMTRFIPWGWSSQAKQLAGQLGLVQEWPDDTAVRDVNSRSFLVPFDRVSHAGLADKQDRDQQCFSCLCRSIGDVEMQLGQLALHDAVSWVIKADLSQAARNRIVGNGGVLSDAQEGWLRKQFRDGSAVAVEPWVERIAEFGLQFKIPSLKATDEIQFEGAAEMLTDSAGRYLGSWICHDNPAPSIHRAIEHGFEVAQAARVAGYLGPMGIDCMLFRAANDGAIRLRMCHDINARNTMGRVALSLKRFLRSGEIGLWLHAESHRWSSVVDEDAFESAGEVPVNTLLGSDVRIVPTSPAMTGSKPTQLKTALLISGSRAALKSVAEQILWHTSSSPREC